MTAHGIASDSSAEFMDGVSSTHQGIKGSNSMKTFGSKTKFMLVLFTGLTGSISVLGTAIAAQDNQGPIKQIKVDAKKAELGKRLFFDPRLSGDAAISCASCHQPDKGFSDGLALSKAYPGSKGFRNTPTLINTAVRKNWFLDSRIGTNLNDVTREMITEDYIMNMDMRLMQERLKQDPVYVKMFKDAGYGEPSNGAVRKAIPEYLKTLTSRNAPFDKGSLTPAAQRGYELFKGKAQCAACHSGSNFTNDKAYNLGVPENPEIWSDPLRHMTYVAFGTFMGIENILNIRRDVGAGILNPKADGSNIGKFATPTLRELKYTAPYMHNGMFSSLFEVVAFYNHGGGQDKNKDPILKPLELTFGEQKDLVAFLESLSGDPLNTEEFVWKKKIPTNYTAFKNWRAVKN
jgi:cytochrome c peroxidase